MNYFHFAIARQIGLAKRNRDKTWDQLRDAIDLKTGGELEASELNILADKADHYRTREHAKTKKEI